MFRGFLFTLLFIFTVTFNITDAYADKANLLIEASRNGDLEKIKALVLDGADINLENSNGFSPLGLAISSNHLNILKSLQHIATMLLLLTVQFFNLFFGGS